MNITILNMPKYQTFISNMLSNRLRSLERCAQYPNIIFDLQHVEPKYRELIIDDIPLSLYAYNDICNVTLKTNVSKNDIVHVHIDYFDTNNVKDEDNILVVHIRLEKYTYQSSTYVIYINIQDTYKTCECLCSVYSIFFLTNELKLPHDWLQNTSYSSHIDELEKKGEHIINIDEYDAKSLIGHTITTESKYTVVFNSAYFIQHCQC